jgi:hypothetical protein
VILLLIERRNWDNRDLIIKVVGIDMVTYECVCLLRELEHDLTVKLRMSVEDVYCEFIHSLCEIEEGLYCLALTMSACVGYYMWIGIEATVSIL